MVFTMLKISFDENNKQRGSFFLMKLPLPKFLSVGRDGTICLVNEAASQALELEGIEFSKLSQITFCCDDFYNFYIMNHIGKHSLAGALFTDKLYYLFTTQNGMIFPEGSPIMYCSWCSKEINHSDF
jgi:hypothetical protein